MTRAAGALLGALLASTLVGCGSDNPPGTLSEDDLPDSVEVKNVREDWAANQSLCQDVNDAEDEHVFVISPSFEKENRAAVAYDLKGSTHEHVSNSVWRLADPKAAVAAVAKGLDACVKANPDNYQRIESVEGYPDALGYDAKEYRPPVFSRRILVPLEDRVVIVSASRDGSDDFSVPPEDLLKKAVAVSDEAPQS